MPPVSANPVRTLRRLMALGVLLWLALAAGFGWQSWQIERAREIEHLGSVLRLGERAVDQYFVMIEAGLGKMRQDLRASPGADGLPDPFIAQPMLAAFRQRHPELMSVNLVAPSGQVLASSQSTRLEGLPNVGADPAFRRFLDELRPETSMVVSRPLFGPIVNGWIVPLRYVMRDAAGRPQAFLTANLPVGFLQTFWQEAPLARTGSIGLLRDDGFLVSRHPVAEGIGDEITYGRERAGALRRHLLRQGFPAGGVVQGDNQLGGAEFLNVFMRLRHQPLTLFVAQPVAALRAGWWQHTRGTWGLLLAVALGGLAAYRFGLGRQLAWEAERQAGETQLRDSEQRWRLLFEHSLDAVLQLTADGRILAANAAACRLLGADEATLQALGRAGLAAPGDGRLEALAVVRQTTGQARGRAGLRRGDGSTFEAELASAAYTDAGGRAMVSAVFRDITDLMRIEAAEHARRQAEQANRAKSEFIARMSHELRTPLNAMLGFAEVMQRDGEDRLSPAQAARLAHVQHAGDHLLQLINDLLDLSRIEAGRLAVQTGDVELLPLVQHAARDIAADAAARGVAVTVEAPAGAALTVSADRTRLLQVVLNLLSNAVKYNRAGGEVRVTLGRAGGGPGAEVQLAVRDTGLGMSAAQCASLFQPFNRLGREASDVPGTGIGLVIARTLVELMGGRVAVRSTPGEGSEFTVTLPCAGPGCAPPAPAAWPAGAAMDAAAHGAAPAGSVPAAAPSQRHVLYIDDEPVNRLLVQAMLASRPQLSLDLAEDGARGLALARQRRPEVVLVDMMMPGLSGSQVLQALRREPALAGVRVVAVSANAMPEDIAEALALGFDDYVTKPIAMDQLLAAVDAVAAAALRG